MRLPARQRNYHPQIIIIIGPCSTCELIPIINRISCPTRTTISGRWPSSDSGRHRLILDVLLEISPKVRPMKTPTITYGHITPSLVSSFSTKRRWNDAPPVNHKFWICIRFSTTIQHYMTRPSHATIPRTGKKITN